MYAATSATGASMICAQRVRRERAMRAQKKDAVGAPRERKETCCWRQSLTRPPASLAQEKM
jgi:hypothetical protein